MEATVEVKLAGKAKILQYLVRLEEDEENEVDLSLFTIDGGKTYSDSDIFIEWTEKLNVKLIVKAFGSVGWDFEMKDQNSGDILIKGSGFTGDTAINFSERDYSFPKLSDQQIISQEDETA